MYINSNLEAIQKQTNLPNSARAECSDVLILYHSAESPLENTNWIDVILQLSEVIDLIWWLK